jgi:hypothetical protein
VHGAAPDVRNDSLSMSPPTQPTSRVDSSASKRLIVRLKPPAPVLLPSDSDEAPLHLHSPPNTPSSPSGTPAADGASATTASPSARSGPVEPTADSMVSIEPIEPVEPAATSDGESPARSASRNVKRSRQFDDFMMEPRRPPRPSGPTMRRSGRNHSRVDYSRVNEGMQDEESDG